METKERHALIKTFKCPLMLCLKIIASYGLKFTFFTMLIFKMERSKKKKSRNMCFFTSLLNLRLLPNISKSNKVASRRLDQIDF